jgi:hypothetical protein
MDFILEVVLGFKDIDVHKRTDETPSPLIFALKEDRIKLAKRLLSATNLLRVDFMPLIQPVPGFSRYLNFLMKGRNFVMPEEIRDGTFTRKCNSEEVADEYRMFMSTFRLSKLPDISKPCFF